MSTDFFDDNRATSFESTRRGLERPGERERARSAGEPGTGSMPVIKQELLPPQTITWGTAVKVSMAIYFALMGVLVTLVIVALLLVRFAMDQIDDLRYDWRSLPTVSSSQNAA